MPAAVLVVVIISVLMASLFSRITLSERQWETLFLQGTFHEGIHIDGFDVSGLTLAEAKKLISENMRRRLENVRVNIVHEGRLYVLTQSDFKTTDNVDEVLKEAMSAAREGTHLELIHKINEIKKNGLIFTTDYTVDTSPAKRRIAEIAAEVDIPATDATVIINKNDRNHRFSYTEESKGCCVDQNALYELVERQIRTREYGVVQMPIMEVPAAVTLAELKANTVLRATASTSFAQSPYNRSSRVGNIKKAVGLINGYVLKPGEGFSTNSVLGPRVYELGWQPAPSLVRGGSEDQAGGGVCQVSSTMYNAVLKADLEVVSRKGHSVKLGYIAGGLDATINTGTIDFIYKNNTDHDIYIFCWVDSSKQTVNFAIYGAPFPQEYDEIRLTSEKIETLEPKGEMLVTVDNSKPPGYTEVVVKRREGAIYESYKHYYKNGVEVREPELIDRTKYNAYAGEKIVGPPASASAGNPQQLENANNQAAPEKDTAVQAPSDG